ncbi:TPP-dependent acetoin dehydrogenase complex, E1 protein subunit beta [Acidocella aquatica]|uniref:TPP-dependent acetoin dehydrogenase complex, E1 protein subunit beta n=1 Tax=Acidocella aquatica TaxID=1922313 RepID=A0ABQ6A4Q5_9PROT|nr:transketolase C-terminal domain-containing protein [Acidocella aquatica]GLR67464.1 TPP-dependent acetoin dehydrogenase complex, E1 protein subunit beta [Acidocella aquatica]
MARATYLEAIRQAQMEEMQRDSRVFIMGEDIICNVFGTTTGFVDMFGAERVLDTPISENGFIGASAGAAMVGARPIVDVTISSFLYPAMDQIISIIAKSRYIYGGQARLPLVIRCCLFYGNSNAAQHSDRPYSMFMNVPGLKIIVPSDPVDMKGMLKVAIRDDDPVLCFEDSTCWSSKADLPTDPDFLIPLGKGDVKREGTDVSVIAVAGAVPLALKAAQKLAGLGISAEIIDPRSLVPLDRDLILKSVRKTGRAITVDPAHQTCSAASEISAMIAEFAFDALRGPVLRVATADTHLPFSPAIEKSLYPSVDRIVTAACRLVGVEHFDSAQGTV